MKYMWPGNVRELKSAFEYAFVTCQEPLIQPHHLPPDILNEEKSFKYVTAVAPTKQEIKKVDIQFMAEN